MNHLKNQSLSTRIDSIHDIMFESNGYFYIKDLKGRYIYLNKNSLESTGEKKISTLVGKDDYSSLMPWQEYAMMYKTNDKLVNPHKESLNVIEIGASHNKGAILLLSNKKTFYHNNTTAGMSGISMMIPDTLLPTNDKPLTNETVFFDNHKGTALSLTKRQRDILFHLLQGKSAKEIASRLFLSKRTVEHHINSIKDNNEYTSTKELLLYVRIV